MTCAACQANVTKAISKLNGVENVNVNLISNTMTVSLNDSSLTDDDIIRAVTEIGYTATIFGKENQKCGFESEWDVRKENIKAAQNELKKRLIWSFALLVPLMYVSMGHMLSMPVLKIVDNQLSSAITQLMLTIPIVFINRKFYISGFRGIIKRAPNMDSLVAIGSSASLLFSIVTLYLIAEAAVTVGINAHYHLYFESVAMILTLVTLGKFLEARSKNKTTSALEKLVDLAPKTATVIRDGAETLISADNILVGDVVVIRPGDTVPVDGVITSGKGYIDQSAITGESLPVEKGEGDSVISATHNKNGHFLFKATKVGKDTTLSQIIHLVDDATNSKAPIARIADKVSGIFVPIVIFIALITAVFWLIAGSGIEFALTRAVSVLVISCPCALGLATPVAIMVGTGKAAGMGILIRSAESLETLHKVTTVFLDKTGTITSGRPSVTDIEIFENNISKHDFLKLTASLESGSNHPFAHSIMEKFGKKDLFSVTDFKDFTGMGICGVVDKKKVCIGNRKLLLENDIALNTHIQSRSEKLFAKGKTVLFVAVNGSVTGIIAVSDTVRIDSLEAIKVLKSLGIKTVMLTGDNKITAEAVRDSVLIDDAVSEIMPSEKEIYITNAQRNGECVAMIGDGINDAPALARADVGIAIGAGTDIAVETADIVLMKDSLMDAVNTIRLSNAVIKNIKLNLFWAFFYNTVGIPIAAGVFYNLFGLELSPMLAAAAMSLSSLFVVGNALRLKKFKAINNISAEPTKNTQKENIMKKTLVIEGMMCPHCKANVEKTLLAISGVTNVTVFLENKTAAVELENEIDNTVLTSAIENAGYTVISCR